MLVLRRAPCLPGVGVVLPSAVGYHPFVYCHLHIEPCKEQAPQVFNVKFRTAKRGAGRWVCRKGTLCRHGLFRAPTSGWDSQPVRRGTTVTSSSIFSHLQTSLHGYLAGVIERAQTCDDASAATLARLELPRIAAALQQ